MKTLTPALIDALLPQTQCGLCGYGGCMPYANAIVCEQAPINLCPPGGISTLIALAQLLNQDAEPYIEDMKRKSKPQTLAVIREAECIGCTKCIQACPVDAIMGAAKHMHTVIASDCTGCELCVPACPVDCIDLIAEVNSLNSDYYRLRFNAREQRLAKEAKTKQERINAQENRNRKQYILSALARVKAKRK